MKRPQKLAVMLVPTPPYEICGLETEDPRIGQIVRLRFFAGLSVEDTAQALGISRRTVIREWTYARAWLYQALAE